LNLKNGGDLPFEKFYDKLIATVKSTTVSDPEIKNAIRIARI